MISFFDASLELLSVHRLGNRAQGESCIFSEQAQNISDEVLRSLLIRYLLSPFERSNEIYRFSHSSGDLKLNEIFHFSSEIFSDVNSFHELSKNIAKYLYDCSNHPKIKAGELYISKIRDVNLEGEFFDAIGIFKSESKETYLKVSLQKSGFALSYEEDAINLQKLDKGCIIFNTEKEEGYRVVLIDQTNRNDTTYWKDDFLQLKIRNDSFFKTNTTLQVYKNFISSKIDDDFEISKADKIDLLNRSIKYFKEKDKFDLEEFSEEVIENPKAIDSFKKFSRESKEEFGADINQPFDISGAAVKKQSRMFKSVLKLDKNFHIYIHGNKELIEKGFDGAKSMNYYKVYFREEK